MGLDGVELVLDIEDNFDLTIPDDVAQDFTTVGHLIEWIALRKGIITQRVCPTAHTFYALRRELCNQFGIARHTITPNTRLSQLVQRDLQSELRVCLQNLGQNPGLRKLVLPVGEINLLWWVLIALAAIAMAFTIIIVQSQAVLLTGFFAILALVISASVVVSVFGTRTIPRHVRVRDVIIAMTDEPSVTSEHDQAKLRAISQTVRETIADQMGLDIDDVSESKRFVRDLGF